MNNRIKKVNSLLEREIGKIIQREISFSDNILVTLTHTDTTSNLIEAKVYISVLPEEKSDEALQILEKSVFDIQQKLNRLLKMRPIPRIKFIKDENLGKAGRVEELLNQLKNNEK